MRSVTILGSTGSIGTQALDVVRRNSERFKVIGLSAAGTNQELLAGQIREFLPPVVGIADETAADEVRTHLGSIKGVEFVVGPDAAERLASEAEADIVLNALVGSSGLGPTLAALQSGKTLALANKESLVVGGELVMDLIKGEPERLLPVDSEHAALAMALRGERREDLKRVVLTGSGGPFRGWTATELAKASMKEALQHPVWSMGPKITIDSATLMNKGLELIEAYHLFPVEPGQLEVVVHPQSIIHALVAYRDGSMLAQLASPDMRTPIALSLSWPGRMEAPTKRIDLVELATLTFERPDEGRFTALALARQAMQQGGLAPTVLNAANEVAVEAFLAGRLGFLQIAQLVAETLETADRRGFIGAVPDLAAVLDADAAARELALNLLGTGRLPAAR